MQSKRRCLPTVRPIWLPRCSLTGTRIWLSRTGIRWHVGGGVEVIVAFAFNAGMIEDHRDLWGGRARPGHTWRQVTWTYMGLEVGLTFVY